jgi:hypothetical protein
MEWAGGQVSTRALLDRLGLDEEQAFAELQLRPAPRAESALKHEAGERVHHGLLVEALEGPGAVVGA